MDQQRQMEGYYSLGQRQCCHVQLLCHSRPDPQWLAEGRDPSTEQPYSLMMEQQNGQEAPLLVPGDKSM